MADEDYEQTLLIIKTCYVYRIPPRTTAAGYKAADWDLSNPIWEGRMVVSSKGDQCYVKLETVETGEIFAICPATETSVEAVNDSSRYFVLRIDDGRGKHAFIGVGFAERNEAFDFNSALIDHNRYVKQEKEQAQMAKNAPPPKDYSLADGQKIVVNIKTKKSATTPKTTSSGGFSLGGGLLPPPPSSNSARSQPSQPTQSFQSFQSAPQQSNSANDLFGDFSSFGKPTTSNPSTQSNNSNSGFDWVGFN
eukprot:TRINITY_DN10460_c0_g1_i1.p1 TRINITY_DN10460_c0_g1~~TRINITY_DN10460_c0_g1_i1.p1  ORF type:complete len:250 (-),score=58.32 TRINITY_DN10460_c0_g1_i1:56-805(-)